jgi:hypothetical protein
MHDPLRPRARVRQDEAEIAGHCLSRLPGVHRNLLLSIENMLALTAGGSFDEEGFSLSRLRLIRASSERRWLWRKILQALIPLVEVADAEALKSLQARDMDLLCATTTHLQHWFPAAVAADWGAYEPQMRALCVRMLKEIGQEQRTLYPLLDERFSRPS